MTLWDSLRGADDVITSGPDGIRQNRVAAGSLSDRRRYGYVANRRSTNEYVAVIRGTDGAEEWFDNFVFVTTQHAPFQGRVETGFVDIYQSMQFVPLNAGAGVSSLGAGLAQLVLGAGSGATIRILGHSLGAVLGTYLTYDLANSINKALVSALFFASPRPGDHDFADGFASTVGEYLVINYQQDLVPKVPPFDILHMDCFRALPDCMIITGDTAQATLNADAKCWHHLICYVALLCPSEFQRVSAGASFTPDDENCATCVH